MQSHRDKSVLPRRGIARARGGAVGAPAQRVGGWLAVALALSLAGCHHKKAAEDLPSMDDVTRLMQSKDKDERYEAVRRLPRLVPANKEALPALISALSDKDPDVRWVATDGLAKIGAAASEAVPKLIEMLGDPDPTVRAGAAHALGTMGVAGLRSVSALEGLARTDPSPDVRSEALRASKALRTVQRYQNLKPQSSK
jgi:HEAT repeat protein